MLDIHSNVVALVRVGYIKYIQNQVVSCVTSRCVSIDNKSFHAVERYINCLVLRELTVQTSMCKQVLLCM
jgi:hypothetical protein